MQKEPTNLDPVRRLVLDIAGRVEGGLKAMSARVGKSHSYFQQFVVRGSPRVLPEDVRLKLVEAYGVSDDQLRDGQYRRPPHIELRRRQSGEVVEVDARVGAGLAASAEEHNISENGRDIISTEPAIATWRMPPDYLRHELRVPEAAVRLVEVIGDSMAPTLQPGDRIMINTSDRRPTPPGIFALWDGLGVVVKRVDHIAHSEPPTLRIISENPHHPDYERTADEVEIIGRVVWFARRI